MSSDIEIARSAKKIPIADVAKKLGISYDDIVPYGHDKAKISDNFLKKICYFFIKIIVSKKS